MPQTDVSTHEMELMLGTRLMRASIWFVVSLGALIGVSLLLAGL